MSSPPQDPGEMPNPPYHTSKGSRCLESRPPPASPVPVSGIAPELSCFRTLVYEEPRDAAPIYPHHAVTNATRKHSSPTCHAEPVPRVLYPIVFPSSSSLLSSSNVPQRDLVLGAWDRLGLFVLLSPGDRARLRAEGRKKTCHVIFVASWARLSISWLAALSTRLSFLDGQERYLVVTSRMLDSTRHPRLDLES